MALNYFITQVQRWLSRHLCRDIVIHGNLPPCGDRAFPRMFHRYTHTIRPGITRVPIRPLSQRRFVELCEARFIAPQGHSPACAYIGVYFKEQKKGRTKFEGPLWGFIRGSTTVSKSLWRSQGKTRADRHHNSLCSQPQRQREVPNSRRQPVPFIIHSCLCKGGHDR